LGLWNTTNSLACFAFVRSFRCQDEERWLSHKYSVVIKKLYMEIFQYISNKMQHYTVYFIWKLLYMFRVVPSPITRRANNCIYSIWYLSHRYCYLSLSWKIVLWVACVPTAIVDGMELRSIPSTIAASSSIGLTIPDAVRAGLCS